jgi:hypothetical protein
LVILIQRTLVLPFNPGKTMPILYVCKKKTFWLFLCESEYFIQFFFAHYILFHTIKTSMGSFQIEMLQKFYPTFSLRIVTWWLLTQLYVLVARDHDSRCQHRLKSTFLIGNVKAKHKSVQHFK